MGAATLLITVLAGAFGLVATPLMTHKFRRHPTALEERPKRHPSKHAAAPTVLVSSARTADIHPNFTRVWQIRAADGRALDENARDGARDATAIERCAEPLSQTQWLLRCEAGEWMKIVADDRVVDEVRRHGGAVYVWPRRDCCSGTLSLDASLLPTGKEVCLVASEPLKVFAPPGMRLPRELHLELGRKSRVRAYWDGLGWIA